MIRPKSPSACPSCGCRRLWKNRTYLRTVVTLEGPETLRVRQRKCARCGKTCADPVRGIEKGARHAKEVKVEALRALFEAEQNVPAVVREMRGSRGLG